MATTTWVLLVVIIIVLTRRFHFEAGPVVEGDRIQTKVTILSHPVGESCQIPRIFSRLKLG